MDWKARYQAALVEVDPGKLLSLIHDTEAAIALRSQTEPKVSDKELQAMGDATCTLQVLKRLELAKTVQNMKNAGTARIDVEMI
jgi:hypothetical protein